MKYVSTRGQAASVNFIEACLAGLAPDGGLYVPEIWPNIAPPAPDAPYALSAARILSAFAGDAISLDDLQVLCTRAYDSFSHAKVAPLTTFGPDQWIMELYHGPTLAFKDVAMQIIAQLYEHALRQSGKKLSIICATSGDTGGAAAAAFAGSEHVQLYILHPEGRISPVQRRFMTTTGADNVHNIALEGDFDDCQAIVKTLFRDQAFADEVGLSGVNSINWVRIVAQSVYFAMAGATLQCKLRFVVPSGNMGDAFAGFVAKQSGLLPHGAEFHCAVNENDALARLLNTGVMERHSAVATPSPAMDISVPSNFERLLYEGTGRDSAAVASLYERFAKTGKAELPKTALTAFQQFGFTASQVTNAQTLAEIEAVYKETGRLLCPHTAVGTFAAKHLQADDTAKEGICASGSGPETVILSTAHAAKFPETVSDVTGAEVPLPARCSDTLDRDELYERLPASAQAVADTIRAGI